MGAFLDHPKIEKYNDSGDGKLANEKFKYAVASMQGWRVDMEDAYHIVVSIKNHPEFENWSFFAVFDGHAGYKAAEYSAECLLQRLLTTKEFIKVVKELKENSNKINDKIKVLIKEGMVKGFMALDEEMHEFQGLERGGTTAICVIVTPEYLFFANLGDSRGLLCRKNLNIFSTEDHKPYLEKERERIIKAGGSVMIQRVNGSLAVSRALGDYDYKTVPNLPQNQQLVSPEPDVYVIERNPSEDEFMVLACDGIFDVLSNNELCTLINSRLSVTQDLEQAANQILDICLSKGSRDNMTLVLVVFDAAPKVTPDAVEMEKEWSEKMEETINELINAPGRSEPLDAEVMTALLKEREIELEPMRPGGIHLARPLIHKILEERGNEMSSGTSSQQQQSEEIQT